MTGGAELHMASRVTIAHSCFQNAVKVFQTPGCIKREPTRTPSKITSVPCIVVRGAAGKTSRLEVL